MFSYFGTLDLGNTPVFYALHCNNCNAETELLDINNIEAIINNRIVLKQGISITCENCNHTHNSTEPILHISEYTNSHVSQTTNSNSLDNLLKIESCLIWD